MGTMIVGTGTETKISHLEDHDEADSTLSFQMNARSGQQVTETRPRQ